MIVNCVVTMGENDSNDVTSEPPEEEDPTTEEETEFLGIGPEEALEMNSSAEEAFSPE